MKLLTTFAVCTAAVLMLVAVGVAQEHAWTRTFSHLGDDEGLRVCPVGSGWALLGRTRAGGDSPWQALVIRLDSSGTEMWRRVLQTTAIDLSATSWGDLFVCGNLPGAEHTVYVLRLSSAGDSVETISVVSPGQPSVTDMALLNDTSIALAVTLFGFEARVLVLNNDGTVRWSVSVGPSGCSNISAVATDGTALVVAGTAMCATARPFLCRLDTAGSVHWTRVYDAPAVALSNVAVLANGSIVAVGTRAVEGYAYSESFQLLTDSSGDSLSFLASGGDPCCAGLRGVVALPDNSWAVAGGQGEFLWVSQIIGRSTLERSLWQLSGQIDGNYTLGNDAAASSFGQIVHLAVAGTVRPGYPYSSQAGAIYVSLLRDSLLVDCCVGTTGNVNKSASEQPDLSDLSLLIAYLVQTPRPALPCVAEANVNASAVRTPDLSDLSLLIAHLIQAPRPTLPSCP